MNYLDFYKGISILFIIITHYSWEDSQRLQLLFPFWIEMAVPIFMVITGYVTAMSFQAHEMSFQIAYDPKELLRKCLRFVIPFAPIYIIQTIAIVFIRHRTPFILWLIQFFVVGGAGQGSYYFPVMIQIVFIFPIIWYIVRKHYLKGLVGCFIANVVYESMKTVFAMSPELYRLLAFRYLFILGFGCFLFVKQNDKHEDKIIWYFIAGIVGIAYIVVFRFAIIQPVITKLWTGTSVFAVLYIVPIMLFLMKPNGIHNKMIELLGKASFNIFLVQMLFYWTVGSKIDSFLPGRIIPIIVNIIICCSFGVAYYKIENPITQRLLQRIRI